MSVRVERLRIARDLHDSVGRELDALVTLAGALRERLPVAAAALADVEERARASGSELHAAVWHLTGESRSAAHLVSHVELRVRDFLEGRTAVHVAARGGTAQPVPSAHGHALLRIVQEAVRNAVTHARPSVIRVSFAFAADRVSVTIEDDGEGLADVAPRTTGGIANIRARAARLGGAVTIASGRGTRVGVELPLSGGGAEEPERLRIARELHDGIGANLTAILWRSQRVARDAPAAERADVLALADRARSALTELRATTWALSASERSWAEVVGFVRDRAGELGAHEAVEASPAERTLDSRVALDVVRAAETVLRGGGRVRLRLSAACTPVVERA